MFSSGVCCPLVFLVELFVGMKKTRKNENENENGNETETLNGVDFLIYPVRN